MAVRGIGYFDGRGQYFKTPQEATLSDLAALLGRMGDGDSLAPGIAKILFDKRRELEHVFRDHDEMVSGASLPDEIIDPQERPAGALASNVTHLPPARSA
jgi:hypothetical protein